MNEGAWDAIHITEAVKSGHNWVYKLTTTVMVRMAVQGPDSTGSTLFSGSFNRQASPPQLCWSCALLALFVPAADVAVAAWMTWMFCCGGCC